MISTAEELRLQKAELEKTVAELRLKFDQAERRSAELREAEEKKHMEEVQFLKKTNLQLKVKVRIGFESAIAEKNASLLSLPYIFLRKIFSSLSHTHTSHHSNTRCTRSAEDY